jgi:hypothetical protein
LVQTKDVRYSSNCVKGLRIISKPLTQDSW